MASKTSKKTAKKSAKKKAVAKPGRPRKTAAGSADAASASRRIDQAIAELTDWRGEKLAEIRKLIHDVDPEVVEDWKWMGTPVWSHDGMYALANAHKEKVKLTFHHGAQLEDPGKLFNAGLEGNKWRAIDFFEGDKINRTALKALLREAIAFNRTHKVPKSKGSRLRVTKKSAVRRKSAAKVTLLSGGNPQIAKGDGDAPVKAYIAAMPGWKRKAGKRLDALISRIVPGVRKAVRWNSPFYGVEGQGWFLAFHCFTKYIKVTFLNGVSLDPPPPVGSKDPNTRYVHLYEDEVPDEGQLADWIRQSSQLPGWIP